MHYKIKKTTCHLCFTLFFAAINIKLAMLLHHRTNKIPGCSTRQNSNKTKERKDQRKSSKGRGGGEQQLQERTEQDRDHQCIGSRTQPAGTGGGQQKSKRCHLFQRPEEGRGIAAASSSHAEGQEGLLGDSCGGARTACRKMATHKEAQLSSEPGTREFPASLSARDRRLWAPYSFSATVHSTHQQLASSCGWNATKLEGPFGPEVFPFPQEFFTG